MTTPTIPDRAAASPDKALGRTPANPGRKRPAGEAGGHSVQDWEQPSPRQGQAARLEGPLADEGQPASAALDDAATAALEGADSPSPPTVPRYLRSDVRGGRSRPAVAPPFDARRQTLTAQSAALVDSIALGVADALAVALRPIIASTVDRLIPMILSLGSVPDPAPIPDAVAWDEVAEGEAS